MHLVAFDPTVGAETKKTRPALIVQNDIDNRYSPVTIALPITSRFDSTLYPTEVLVRPPDGGLRLESVVLANQIRCIDKARLIQRLGTLRPQTMAQVDRALQISLGLIEL